MYLIQHNVRKAILPNTKTTLQDGTQNNAQNVLPHV